MPVIYKILGNRAYVGDTVNFTTLKPSYKSKEKVFQSEDKWAIFENTHEPIIDRETFDIVQRMRESRRVVRGPYNKGANEEKQKRAKNKFIGIAFCADCGKKMVVHLVSKREHNGYLVCSSYRKHQKRNCTSHRIRLDHLEEIVLNDLRKVCGYVKNHEKEFIEHYFNESQKQKLQTQMSVKREYARIEKRIKEIDEIIRMLYEDRVLGKITDKRYDSMSLAYEEEQDKLTTRKAEIESMLAQNDKDNQNLDSFIKLLKKYTRIKELTPELLYAFINRIEIGDKVKNSNSPQEIKIFYNFIGAITIPN